MRIKIFASISAISILFLATGTGHAASGTPSIIGNVPHLAWGGGWESVVFLNNYGATDAAIIVNSYGNDGSPIALPWTDPFTASQTGVTGASVSSLSLTLRAGMVAAILLKSDAAADSGGWAQILSDSTAVTGGVDFKYNVGDMHGEGMVAIDNGAAKTWDMVFFGEKDSINCDFAYEFTSYAIANVTASPVTITRTIVDRTTGTLKFQDLQPLTLQAHGHTAFVAWDLAQQPDNTGIPSGIWVLRVSAPGVNQIVPLALHFRQDKGGLDQDGKSCRMGPRVFESVPTWIIP